MRVRNWPMFCLLLDVLTASVSLTISASPGPGAEPARRPVHLAVLPRIFPLALSTPQPPSASLSFPRSLTLFFLLSGSLFSTSKPFLLHSFLLPYFLLCPASTPQSSD